MIQTVQYRPSFLRSVVCGLLSFACVLIAPAAGQGTGVPVNRVEEDYELMKLFVETFEQIDSNYVRDVDRRELMQAAIRGMLDHLDEYSTYIPKADVRRFDQIVEQEFGGIGVDVSGTGGRLTVVSPLPGTPAFRAGIRSGDVIVEVDGVSTEGFRVSDAVKVLQGPPGRPVQIGVRRPGVEEIQQFTMVREVIQVPTVMGDHFNGQGEWEFMLDDARKLGYVRMSHFSRHTVEEMKKAAGQPEAARGVQGLILDLRSNPGGLLDAAIEISDLFLDAGDIVSIKGRSVPFREWKARRDESEFPPVPVAVLVNRYSASASEVLAACLQDNKRAIVVGERTWGKGSVQNVIRLEADDSALKLTTASYHRPSGVNIHRFPGASQDDEWGVRPSEGYEVRLSDAELEKWFRNRRQQESLRAVDAAPPQDDFTDPQLNKALEYLLAEAVVPAAVPQESSVPPKSDEAAAAAARSSDSN